MRYVLASSIKKGMVLGQSLYDQNFALLFGKGEKLKNAHIETICELGYSGVYIEDEPSAPVLISPLIPDTLRLDTIKAAKKFLEQAQNDAGKHRISKISTDQQESVVMPIIDTLQKAQSHIIDYFDIRSYSSYDYYHAVNVMVISLVVGLKLGISGKRLFELGISALMHDVGNAFLPSHILNKPGKLSSEEFAIVQSHIERGHDYLCDHYDLSLEACKGALHHHENYDGSGYPGNLRRNSISQFGRIISLCDVFDALVSRRPFRNALYPSEALDIIRKKADRKFDPEIVHTIENVIAPYPVTASVRLNTSEQGFVIQNNPDDITRPKLYVPPAKRGSKGYTIDLNNESNKNALSVSIVH